ncbi:unnamed protein product [Aphanomyces euteiches]
MVAKVQVSVLLAFVLLALLPMSSAQTFVGSDSGVHIFYQTKWSKPYIHYNIDGTWSSAPGVALTASADAAYPSANGWYRIDIASASKLEFVFNDGQSSWDNNNQKNYFASSAGTWKVSSVGADSGVHIFYQTQWPKPYIHYNNGAGWTTVPGVAMSLSNYPSFPSSSGWFRADFASTASIDFVFNNGQDAWDNNNNANYHATNGTWKYVGSSSGGNSGSGGVKAIFAHYMVGGKFAQQAAQDVKEALAIGLDGFIINVQDLSSSWSLSNVADLFSGAQGSAFKLLFSWDMDVIAKPSLVVSLFVKYASHANYYKYNDKPMSSTFWGGKLGSSTWQTDYKNALSAQGVQTYFVPAFDDISPSTSTLTNYPVDGLICWECAWAPQSNSPGATVLSTQDSAYIQAAKAAGKSYMMGISTHQYKHIDQSWNWYRPGNANVGLRIKQVLELQPDFVQVMTWNDAGEGHYFGRVWQWSVDSSPAIQAYVYGYPHDAFQQVYKPFFIGAKAGAKTLDALSPQNGRKVQGAFWYQPLLNGGDCSADTIGKPGGYQAALDTVNVAATFSSSGAKVTVKSGGSSIGSFTAKKGLNYWSVSGLKVGQVSVSIVDADGATQLSSVTGNVTVANKMSLCNYNYAVYGL